jgi:hypothetical protein
MAKFVVQQEAPTKVLEVVIGEESFNVPLVSELTFKEAVGLETAEGTRIFMQKYIPKKILDTLTIGQYNSIVEAWKAESGYNTTGES